MTNSVQLSRLFFKYFVGIFVAISWSLGANAEPPAVKFEKGTLISPSAANSYYGSSTTHTNRLCQLQSNLDLCEPDFRPTPIKQLALTLGNGRVSDAEYTQNVYEYVYMNIETEFRYGLSKGAFGVLLDQSGTSFDQANLMVELLREGGVSANYNAGTITLSSNQLSRWSGFYTTLNEGTQATTLLKSAACQFLADGGIPASCLGSTDLTNITLSTIWVSSGGKLYNPSYKVHELKAGLSNLTSIMGCGGSCGAQVANAGLNGRVHTDSIGTYAQNINEAAMATNLNTFAVNLENHIKTNMPNAKLIHVTGGKEDPARENMPTAASILPYSSSVQKTWMGDIPDQYRTRVAINLPSMIMTDGSSGSQVVTNKALFADEIYSASFQVVGKREENVYPTERVLNLKLNLSKYNIGLGSSSFSLGQSLLGVSKAIVNDDSIEYELMINHPYAANSGSFMDLLLSDGTFVGKCQPPFYYCGPDDQHRLNSTYPLTIPFYLGEVGAAHANSIDDRSAQIIGILTAVIFDHGGVIYGGVDHVDSNLEAYAIKWYYQSQIAGKIVDQLSDRATTNYHHAIGVLKDVSIPISVTTITGIQSFEVTIQEQEFHLVASLNIQPVDDSSIKMKKAQYMQATLLNAMEGSVIEQSADVWAGASVISMMQLADEKGYKIYQVDSSNKLQFQNASVNYNSAENEVIDDYVSANYDLILPINGNLGQYGTNNEFVDIVVSPIVAATQNLDKIAHITSIGSKGGSSPGLLPEVSAPNGFTDAQNDYLNPSVDLSSGEFSLTLSPDIVSGSGDFPYSLPFVRQYSRSRDFDIAKGVNGTFGSFTIHEVGLPQGWTHNYEIGANFVSNPSRAFGELNPTEASNFLSTVATLYQLDIMDTFRFKLAHAFSMDWFADSIQLNELGVTLGGKTDNYFQLPSGKFQDIGGVEFNVQIIKAPEKTTSVYGFRYLFDDISLSISGPNKQTMYFETLAPLVHSYVQSHGLEIQFGLDYRDLRISEWHFPEGVQLNFQYTVGVDNVINFTDKPFLTRVSNNLGRYLAFPTSGQAVPGAHQLDREYFSVQDETGRKVSFRKWFKVILPDGSIKKHSKVSSLFSIDEFDPQHLGDVVPFLGTDFDLYFYNDSDLVDPTLSVAFDASFDSIYNNSLGKVIHVTDAEGIKTNYYPASLFSERYGRGEVVDALDNITTTYFDDKGRPIKMIEPSYEEVSP